MSIVRIKALEALGALIASAVPELQGHVCVGIAPPGEFEALPNVSIEPTTWEFLPEQEDEQRTLPGNRVVYRVGEHACACVISVVTASIAKRWEIEAAVLDLFLRAKHPLTGHRQPGVIVAPVTACPELGQWIASFELESDAWNESYALDRRYESRITINAHIPALIVDSPIYTINELILGLTQDMQTTFTPATAIPPAVELVVINEDGSISKP